MQHNAHIFIFLNFYKTFLLFLIFLKLYMLVLYIVMYITLQCKHNVYIKHHSSTSAKPKPSIKKKNENHKIVKTSKQLRVMSFNRLLYKIVLHK